MRIKIAYIKRDGRALIKLISDAPFGGGQVANQVTNNTFKMTLMNKNKELIQYEVLETDRES